MTNFTEKKIKKDFISPIKVPEGRGWNSKEDTQFNLLASGLNKIIEQLEDLNKKLIRFRH